MRLDLQFEELLPTPIDAVWRAITDPRMLARWLMENDFQAHVGARFVLRVANPPAGSRGIPPSRYSGHYRGWIKTYWTPMREILRDGRLSEKTLARLKLDREERIDKGHFRRGISKDA